MDFFTRLDHRYALAPMVDQCDLPFRIQCRLHGATIIYAQMIIAEKYLSDPEYRKQVFDPARGDGDPTIDRPLVVQIAGNDKHLLLQCAQSLEPYCDAIDFNMGCPQQRAVDGGHGSSLLPVSQWPLVAEIVSHLSQNLKVPVWCKLRLVAGNKSLTHKLTALLADNGCKLVTLHARYASVTRRRQGLADLNEVKILKDVVTSIPILSNGNVRTLQDVTKNLEFTGADGIMVGEALLANPWLFEGKEADSVGIIREYLDICANVHADAFSIPSVRQHIRNFLRANVKSSNTKFKDALNSAEDIAQIIRVLQEFSFFPSEYSPEGVLSITSPEVPEKFGQLEEPIINSLM